MDPRQAWRLSGSVALRAEPFGALAYNFNSRSLTFLKTPTLVRVVRELAQAATVDAALRAADVADGDRNRYLVALDELASTGLIHPAPADDGPGHFIEESR